MGWEVTCNLVLSKGYVVGGHSLKTTRAPLRKSRFLKTVRDWSVPPEADMIIPGSHRTKREVRKTPSMSPILLNHGGARLRRVWGHDLPAALPLRLQIMPSLLDPSFF